MNASVETVFNILFGLALVLAVVWLVSVDVLRRKLKEDHYETYHAVRNGMALTKFILKREYQSLDDTYLSRLCGFMRILFITSIVNLCLILAIFLLLIPLSRAGRG